MMWMRVQLTYIGSLRHTDTRPYTEPTSTNASAWTRLEDICHICKTGQNQVWCSFLPKTWIEKA